jgi:hypothetical protein
MCFFDFGRGKNPKGWCCNILFCVFDRESESKLGDEIVKLYFLFLIYNLIKIK